MIDSRNKYHTGSATFFCRNVDLLLGGTERHTERLAYDTEINNLVAKSINVSNFANGVYTISIFKNDTEVASIQLLVTH